MYKRVEKIIDSIFDCGFFEEDDDLINQGIKKDSPALSAIGYSEVEKYICGQLSLEEAKQSMSRKTKNFIRKQANWFKPEDQTIEWFAMDPDPVDRIRLSVNRWLGKE